MADNLTPKSECCDQSRLALAEVEAMIARLKRLQRMLQAGLPIKKSDRPRGCTWDKQNKSWKVRASVNGKTVNVGSYKTVEEARAAYFAAKAEDV